MLRSKCAVLTQGFQLTKGCAEPLACLITEYIVFLPGPKRKQRNKKESRFLRLGEKLLNFKLMLLGLPKV